MRSNKTNFNIQSSTDKSNGTASALLKLKSAKWFVLVFSVIVLISDILAFALSDVSQETYRYWLFPMFLAIVDLLYIVSIVFTNFRFRYSVRLTVSYVIISAALLAASSVLATTSDVVMSFRAILVLCGTHIVYWIILFVLGYFLLKKDGTFKWGKGISVMLLGAMTAVMCAVFVFGHGYFGQDKFLEKGRDIVYRYDSDAEAYVATALLPGAEDTVFIPQSFNGKQVFAIDCGLFNIASAKTVYIEGEKERKFTNLAALKNINPELVLMVEKSVVDSYRSTLYASEMRQLSGRDTLLHSLTVSDVPQNQTTVTFNVATNDLADKFSHIFIPTIYKNIGEGFLIDDLLPYLNNYIGKNDAQNEFHLAYNYETNEGEMLSFAHQWNDNQNTQNLLEGKSLSEKNYSAMLTFENVVKLEFSVGNDTVYRLPEEYKSVSEENTVYSGRYVFRSKLNEFFERFPKRNEFDVNWKIGLKQIADGGELQSYVTQQGIRSARLVPQWTLQAPAAATLEADSPNAAYTYGDSIRISASGADTAIKTHYALSFGNEKLVADSLDGVFDLLGRKPAQTGNYTVTSWKQDSALTSLVSQKVTTNIFLKISKKQLGLIWTLPQGVYDATQKQVAATIDANDLLPGDLAEISVSCKLNNADVGLSIKNAGQYIAEANITLSSELYQLKTTDKNQTFRIEQAELNVIWSNVDLVYNAEFQKPIAVATGVGADGAIAVTVSDRQKNAGSYVARADIANGNYRLVNLSKDFVIAKKSVTVIWSEVDSFEYTAKEQWVIPNSLNGVITGEEVLAMSSLEIDGKRVNAGVGHTTEARLPQESNYQFDTVQKKSFIITPKALSISANNVDVEYNASVYTAFDSTSEGLAGTDNLKDVLTLSYSGTAVGAINYAPNGYVITPQTSAEGSKYANYAITYRNGKLTISKAELTITAEDKQKVYDSEVYADTNFSVQHSALKGNDTLEEVVTVEYSGTAVGAINYAPNGYVITPQMSAEGSKYANYAITYRNGKLTISKAELTITAEDKQKVYDSEVYADTNFSVQHSALKGNDTLEEVVTVEYSGTAVGAINYAPNGYVITPQMSAEGSKYANYAITYRNGKLTINKALLTITAVGGSKVYDGSPFSYTFSTEGLKGQDTIQQVGTVEFGGTAVTAVNVGDAHYPLTVSISQQGIKYNNYQINYVEGSITINKAPLTISAVGNSKVYDGLVFDQSLFDINVVGLFEVDALSQLGTVEFYGEGTTNANATTTPYVLSVRFITQGIKYNNYQIELIDGQVTITQAVLTITAVGGEKTYDGKPFYAQQDVKGLKGTDTIAEVGIFTVVGDGVTDAANAAYDISISLTDKKEKYNNYHINYVEGSITINKALVIITAVGGEKTYDGKPYFASYEVVGLVSVDFETDLGSFLLNGNGAINASSIPYTLSVTIKDLGQKYHNYLINYVEGSITINKAPLTVTALGGSKVYDGLVFDQKLFGINAVGLVEGDMVSQLGTVEYYGEGTTNANVTTTPYALSVRFKPQGEKYNNYQIELIDGQVMITQAVLTITAVGGEKEYDGSPYLYSHRTEGLKGQDTIQQIGTVVFGGTAANAVNVGDAPYPLTVSILQQGIKYNNYQIELIDGQVMITQATLTITAVGGSKEYDGSPFTEFKTVTSGLINGESLQEVGVIGFEDAAVNATDASDNPYGLKAKINSEGTKFNNYKIMFVAGEVRIYKKEITIVWSQTAFTVNGLAQTPEIKLSEESYQAGITVQKYLWDNAEGQGLNGAPTAVGTYKVKVIYSSTNYSILNAEIEFEITIGGEAI